MSSRKGSRLLEESTGAVSYGAISNPVPVHSRLNLNFVDHEFTASAPAVLEPSKDPLRLLNRHDRLTIEDSNSPPIDPWKKLVTSSCAIIPSAGDLLSSTEVIVPADEQRNTDGPHTNEHLATRSSFINSYRNLASKLKTSKFIHVFQALFLLMIVSGMVMGSIAINYNSCPESERLPIFNGLTGLIGLLFSAFWIAISCNQRYGRQISEETKFSFVLFFVMLSAFVLIEMYIFGTMSCSFDGYSPNYCSKAFYYYILFKETATATSAVLAMMIYLPDCLSFFRCRCFSRTRNVTEQ